MKTSPQQQQKIICLKIYRMEHSIAVFNDLGLQHCLGTTTSLFVFYSFPDGCLIKKNQFLTSIEHTA